MDEKKLVELALAAHPCCACNSAECALARHILVATGHVYAGTARGVPQWKPKEAPRA